MAENVTKNFIYMIYMRSPFNCELGLTFGRFLNIAVLFRCLKKLNREHLLKSGTGPPL
jgi:hypothetical protein